MVPPLGILRTNVCFSKIIFVVLLYAKGYNSSKNCNSIFSRPNGLSETSMFFEITISTASVGVGKACKTLIQTYC